MLEKLTIIPLYSALLALFYVGLSCYVITRRWKHLIGLGTGDNREMEKAVRIHGNFNEYIPLSLILLLILEIDNFYPHSLLHLLGVMLILGRILHFVGIKKTRGTSMGRTIGTGLTLLYLILSSVLLIYSRFY